MNPPTLPLTPTSDAELNGILYELVSGSHAILLDNFIGAYLHGSLVLGDWDSHSDVDFLIAVAHDVSEAQLSGLQALHSRLYDLPSHWAHHLEGSYVPVGVLRRAGSVRQQLPFLDNTSRTLVLSDHDNTLVVRWMLRERGIVMAGADPKLLIDPVSADTLREEVWETMQTWGAPLLIDPEAMNNRWYQPYAVLSYCRMLHTLQTGQVGSKPAGANWARGALDSRWADLIQRAWDERPNPTLKIRQPAHPVDLDRTVAFIRYALSIGTQFMNR